MNSDAHALLIILLISIEELSSYAMLEPSFLHPGTLSALPNEWKAFAVAVVEAEQQVGWVSH